MRGASMRPFRGKNPYVPRTREADIATQMAPAGARPKRKSGRNPIAVLIDAWQTFNRVKAMRLASAVAFAMIFSLVPLFVVFITVGSAVLGFEDGRQHSTGFETHLLEMIRSRAGTDAANTLRTMIDHTYAQPHQTQVARLIGSVTLFLSATNLFAAIQDGINTVWEIDTKRTTWRQMLRDRIAAYVVFLIVGVVAALFYFANAIFPVGVIISTALTLLVLTIIFTLLLMVLPDVSLRAPYAIAGAFITSVLFFAGQALIGWYFSRGGVLTAYGAAGSLFVTLLWLYYSTMIFLFGASLTRAMEENAAGHVPYDDGENQAA